MTLCRTTLLIFLFTSLSGCTGSPSATVRLSVDSSDPDVVLQAESVLTTRFERRLPRILSTLETEVAGPEIALHFINGAPDREVIERLCCTEGRITAYILDGGERQDWLTNSDVADTDAGLSDGVQVVYIQLNDEAGAKTLELTRNNIGKVAVVELDGVVLQSATIRSEFSTLFQLTAPADFPATDVAALMLSDPLPAKVSFLALEDGS